MRILLVRHAIAVERGTPGIADAERALTSRGRRRFRTAARGLATLVPAPEVLLSSPLRRARQTAELLRLAWGGRPVSVRVASELAQGRPVTVEKLLRALARRRSVALVGHEPYLSALIAHLLGARRSDGFNLRKGGAALLEWDGSPHPARLVWLAPPKLLRLLP